MNNWGHETVSSVQEFIEWAESSRKKTDNVLFRGQRKKWPLLPSICRSTTASGLIDKESRLFDKFKKKATDSLHLVPNNDWDWMVVAQHHGLPTRLLDWTKDPKVALWFALEKADSQNDSDPILWMICPEADDYVAPKETTRPFAGTRTKLFETDFTIPRVRAQKGCFSVFKHVDKSHRGFVRLEENKYMKDRLYSVRVQNDATLNMISELKSLGYHHDSIYPPELDQIAREVKDEILTEVSFHIK